MNISSFSSVRTLAQELNRLDANASAYEELLSWKQQGMHDTRFGQALKKCVGLKDVKCAVCDEVLRRRSQGTTHSSLVPLQAFGYCPAESKARFNHGAESARRLQTLTDGASQLEFVPSEPSSIREAHRLSVVAASIREARRLKALGSAAWARRLSALAAWITVFLFGLGPWSS